VDVLGGETRTEEFARINHMQQVPVLVDAGHVVQDSQAILLGEANPSASCQFCRIGDHLSSRKCAINTSVGVLYPRHLRG
jgi:hypothetical protein